MDNRQGILSVNMISENIEVDKPYASSLDVTINGYTTASDYFNFKAEKWTPADLSFVHTKMQLKFLLMFWLMQLPNPIFHLMLNIHLFITNLII